MNVFIVRDENGKNLSLHQTLDGVVQFVFGHEENPKMEGRGDLEIEGLRHGFMNNPVQKITFSNGESIIVERHALLV